MGRLAEQDRGSAGSTSAAAPVPLPTHPNKFFGLLWKQDGRWHCTALTSWYTLILSRAGFRDYTHLVLPGTVGKAHSLICDNPGSSVFSSHCCCHGSGRFEAKCSLQPTKAKEHNPTSASITAFYTGHSNLQNCSCILSKLSGLEHILRTVVLTSLS